MSKYYDKVGENIKSLKLTVLCHLVQLKESNNHSTPAKYHKRLVHPTHASKMSEGNQDIYRHQAVTTRLNPSAGTVSERARTYFP